jgi:hypothetical protein
VIGGILQSLLGGLFGSAIQSAERAYVAYVATRTSEVEREKVRADLARAALDHALETRRVAQQIRLTTAGFGEMRFVTFCIAGSFTLHLAAVTLDTVFGFGWRIPKYPPPFDEYQGAILLSFFGLQGATRIAATLAAAFVSRGSGHGG